MYRPLNACLAVLLLSAVSPGPSQAGEPGESLGRMLTTVERMAPEHLKAAHEDVQAYQSRREEVGLQTGLTDFRAILHAHAEDAAHTGGTRAELLEDAKDTGVSIVFLSNHYRPPRDFMTDTYRGIHDGVLFVPGSETNGFLIHPMGSIIPVMSKQPAEILKATTYGDGLAFLSHVEERMNHSMEGLTGMEIYNRHADAMDDMGILGKVMQAVTDPAAYAAMRESLEVYPAEMLASQLDYPEQYFSKWDAESPDQRVVGIAANDCHHNQVFISKMVDEETVLVGTIVDSDKDMRTLSAEQYPSIREMTKGKQPGDVLATLDFDPYRVSFHNVSTHILAGELEDSIVRKAVKAGHVYVSHDWMCDPTGFAFAATHVDDGKAAMPRAIMGDEIEYASGLRLNAEFPVKCDVRLIKNGEVVQEKKTRRMNFRPDGPGVYRIEGWLEVDGEDRPWVYSNPIYVR